jgi:hypothetical protein
VNAAKKEYQQYIFSDWEHSRRGYASFPAPAETALELRA